MTANPPASWRALLVPLVVVAIGFLATHEASGDEKPHGPPGHHTREAAPHGHADEHGEKPEKPGMMPGMMKEKGHHEERGHPEDEHGHARRAMAAGPLEQRGMQLVSDLHCNACHLVSEGMKHEHHGGHGAVAPDLSTEGDKVQPQWLFEFLKGPHRLRPWLPARMPTFKLSDREALALTEHFVSDLRDRTLPPLPRRFRYPTRSVEENLKAGTQLVSADYLDCFNCHQAGDRKPQGPPEEWAPDLALARSRLRADWVVRWLLDPQRIQRGTKMPTYFSDEESGPDDILDGDEGRQIIALRDYVLSLGPESTSTAYAEAKKRYPDVTSGEGWALMQQLNCGGCHNVGQMHERHEVAPPLAHQGSRVRREWLVEFLQNPTKLRPVGYVIGTPSQMPDFQLSHEEVEAISAFLMSQRMSGLGQWWQDPPRPETAKAGQALYETWNCASCHRMGDSPPGAIATRFEGPDLARVSRRLQPDHLLFWLKGDSGTVDTHPIVPTFGLSDVDLKALVTYLMTLS